MKERTRSTIDIKRGTATILTVPITEASKRRFSLMTEDSVTLAFELPEPVRIAIGDYIDDELFGHFVVTKEQMPQYNQATGGYTYTLQLDREYIRWGNRLMMFIQGTERRESQWFLTADIHTHADEVLRNVQAIGHEGYSIEVGPEVEQAGEYRLISYEGQTILAALGHIADTWQCEWWISDDRTIHLGKCEDSSPATPLQFRLGSNVETMTIQDNRSHYANRIYAYGSTDNIPATYRRRIQLRIVGANTTQSGHFQYSTDKKLTADMFPAIKPIEAAILRYNFDNEFSRMGRHLYHGYKSELEIDTDANYQIHSDLTHFASITGVAPRGDDIDTSTPYDVRCTIIAMLVLHGPAQDIVLASARIDNTIRIESKTQPTFVIPAIDLPGVSTEKHLSAGHYQLYLTYDVTIDGGIEPHPTTGPRCTPSATTYLTISQGATGSGIIKVSDAAGEWTDAYVKVNIDGFERYSASGLENPQYYAIAFCDAAGQPADPPQGFNQHGSILIDPSSETVFIPSAYYTTDFDNPSSLARIGEPRLQLPADTPGYIDSGDHPDAAIVEEAVIFPDIFPRCDLKVSDIDEERRMDRKEYEGEDITTDWRWTEYTVQLTRADGHPFPFSEDYILPGQKLQIKFLPPQDVATAAETEDKEPHCKLAGMTFDVEYEGAGRYIIVRNDQYGALLPSEAMRPHIDDPCILLGWNPRAMRDLGLIEQAEQRLMAKAQEYADAMEEGQFTFDCTIRAGYLFSQVSNLRLFDAARLRLLDSNSAYLWVRNGNTAYSIPTEGQRATIISQALTEGSKTSRIIGYELKLDKPYDAPRYTVGDTQAYSRLARIEREIKNK